jgi:RNA polymerase-binding transcription factor DksA
LAPAPLGHLSDVPDLPTHPDRDRPDRPDQSTPDDQSAEDWRARLESERERLTGLVETLGGEVAEAETDATGDLAAYDQHSADAGSETTERTMDLTILEQVRTELDEVEAALRRLDDGTFGIDERTGEPIDPERLDAVPTARTNIARGPA